MSFSTPYGRILRLGRNNAIIGILWPLGGFCSSLLGDLDNEFSYRCGPGTLAINGSIHSTKLVVVSHSLFILAR
jgi:hypothetical protein